MLGPKTNFVGPRPGLQEERAAVMADLMAKQDEAYVQWVHLSFLDSFPGRSDRPVEGRQSVDS